MSNIADDIQNIVQEARQQRQKTASSQEAEAAEKTISSPIADKLRKTASKIKADKPGIDAQYVVDFIRELQ